MRRIYNTAHFTLRWVFSFGAVSSIALVSICPGYPLQADMAFPEPDEGQAFHFYPAAFEQKNIDLKVLTTIAKSKKKDFIENKILTPKYNRQYLGSFGIGIISFLSLGNKITIFTKKRNRKTLCIEIHRRLDENGKTIDIPIIDIQINDEFTMHLINGDNTQSGTTIEIENTKLDLSDTFQTIKYKLSNPCHGSCPHEPFGQFSFYYLILIKKPA